MEVLRCALGGRLHTAAPSTCCCKQRPDSQSQAHTTYTQASRNAACCILNMAQLLYACILLLFLVPATFASCTLFPEPCVLSCEDCASGQYVADPQDCTRYYRCQGSGVDDYYDTPFDCPSGEYFDPSAHRCSATATCTSCPDVRNCRYECPASGVAKISHRYDCNYYDYCNNGAIILTTECDSSTPYFDGVKCQDDETQCCHCHPYCSLTQAQNNDKVPDPQDCRRYYTCFTEGTPTEFTKCADGYYFDEFLQKCLERITCIKPCINVVGEDGCIDPFTCLEQGYFARCPDQCTPDYYHCDTVTNDFVEAQSCTNGVFHPTDHTCVAQEKCP